jgi:hypothetical protein
VSRWDALPRKLTWAQVEEIRRGWEAGVTQVALGEQYGVTQSHVSRIVSGSRRKQEV